MKRFISWFTCFVLVFCSLSHFVFAHANLLEAYPKNGEIVSQSPDKITLTFSEPLELETINLKVLDANGREINLPEMKLTPGNARQLYAKLPNLPQGTYTVQWSVISEDGHPVSDTYSFSVGKETPVGKLPADNSSGRSSDFLLVFLRYVVEGLILLGGGLYWIAWLVEKRGFPGWTQILKRGHVVAYGILLIGTVGLWIAYLSSLPKSVLSTVIMKGNISLLRQIPFAGMLAAHSILLILLALPGMVAGWYLMIWLLLICTLAFGGHAWGIEPLWLSLAGRMVHVLALSAWMGALSYLALAMYWEKRNSKPMDRSRLRPFFVRVAMLASSLTALSGVLMASIQTDWTAVVREYSAWNILLFLKIGLILVMLLLALRQTLQWKNDGQSLSHSLLRWEWFVGMLAILAGVWMSQSKYPLP